MADLSEITASIISHTDLILTVVFILAVTFIVAQIAGIWVSRMARSVGDRSRSGSTKLVMLRHVTVGVIYAVGFLIAVYTIPSLRTFSATLLAGAGLAAMVLGLAAQSTFSNMVSGLALVFFRPFDIGDKITVGGDYGEVIDINLRQTTLETFDNKRIIIPNSSLNSLTITNWTANADKTVIGTITVGVSYDSDIDKAREIMIEEARKSSYVMKSEEVRELHGDDELPDVKARVIELAPYSVDIRLDFWVYTRSDLFSAQTEIREAIKKRIDAEPSVSIPFPHTTVLFGNPMEMKENGS